MFEVLGYPQNRIPKGLMIHKIIRQVAINEVGDEKDLKINKPVFWSYLREHMSNSTIQIPCCLQQNINRSSSVLCSQCQCKK